MKQYINEDENKCDNIDNDSNTIHTIECSVKHDNNEKEDTLRVGDEVIGERLEGATNVASGCNDECDDRHKASNLSNHKSKQFVDPVPACHHLFIVHKDHVGDSNGVDYLSAGHGDHDF